MRQPIISYIYIYTGMPSDKDTDITGVGQDVKQLELCLSGCKWVQVLWETYWRYRQSSNRLMSCDPATPHLGIYSVEMCTYVTKNGYKDVPSNISQNIPQLETAQTSVRKSTQPRKEHIIKAQSNVSDAQA